MSVSAGALARPATSTLYRLEGIKVSLIDQIDRADSLSRQAVGVDVTPHADMRDAEFSGGFTNGHDFTISHASRIQNT